MIIAAAVLLHNKIWTLAPPKRHHDIIAFINNKTEGDNPILIAQGMQGFIDHNCNFLTREEAAIVAEKGGQIKSKLIAPPKLFSEDLW